MFVNYARYDARSTPLNLAMARAIVAAWLGWKLIWYDMSAFVDTPYLAAVEPAWAWAIPIWAPWVLTLEQYALIGSLGLFALGYRIRLTATVSALLAAHLGTVRFTLNTTGETEAIFIGVMFLLVFALYAEYDRLSIDEYRRHRQTTGSELVERLTGGSSERFRMPQLRYALLILAIIYFGSGFDKLVQGDLFGFVAPDNLARIITVRSVIYGWQNPIIALIVEYPLLSAAGAVATLVLELGLLVAVLAGITITPFALGIIGFTLANVVVLGIFFVDTVAMIGLFVALDRVHLRLTLDRDLDLVFDGYCHFCMRVLLPFAYLDPCGTVTYHPHFDVPERLRERDDVDFEQAMYVFHDDEAFGGYDAFHQFFRQFRLFAPIAGVMARSPVRAAGHRVYRYVAANRGRHFTCRLEES